MSSKEENAAKAAKKPIEDAVAAGKQTIEQAVKASTEGYEQAVAMSKEQIESASKAMFRGYDDLATVNKEGVEAVMKASDIWAKGYEDISKAYFAFARVSAVLALRFQKPKQSDPRMQPMDETLLRGWGWATRK